MSSTTKQQFSVGAVLACLFRLVIAAILTGIGIVMIPRDPRVGWISTILFGTCAVVMVIELVRVCGRDQVKVPDVKSQLNIRRALVPAGVTLVTIILGLAENLISLLFTDSFARPGVWLGTFATTLAFYPLREQKDLGFKVWIIFGALMGVAAVALSYLKDWL
jgi:hypothetical protein